MRQTIDGAAFQRMIISAAASIEIHKQQINELNVFPVPDGDTGTNMSMTMNTAVNDLRKQPGLSLSKAADVAASALLRGARGNSGVILSLLFRGFSKSMKGKKEIDGSGFASALSSGVAAAYKAVMKPAEGTILTVSRVTAEAITEEAKNDPAAEHVIEYAISAAKTALAETIHQNPVLEKAGVIDAGGMGFVRILEGMLASLQGQDLEAPAGGAVQSKADFAALSGEDITFTYDTVFTVRKGTDKSLDLLRAYLGTIGDSLVIGEDDDSFKVHVHTDTPGAALTEAQKYGTLELAKIENMRTQYEDMAAGRKPRSTDDLEDASAPEPAPAPPAPPVQKKFGVVTVCAGDGIAAVFHDLGVDCVVEGGQTMNPSTEDILQAIEHAPSDVVFVLPNNKNIIMAAEQAVPLTKKQAIVIPSKTVPQGVTAMLSFDPESELEINTAAMTEALGNVTTMHITYAVRDSDFGGTHIRKGDYLALYNGALFGTDRSAEALLNALALKVAEEDKAFVTIFYGQDIDAKRAGKAQAIFNKRCPDAEVTLLSGGQPVYYYLISAE